MKRLTLFSPAQLIVLAFAPTILFGSFLLWLPISTTAPGSGSYLTAIFTSTSAVCVTGLIVADTPNYYTHFGQVVIMGLIQVGGFGIMTLTSLIALLVARRLGLRSRLIAQAEKGTFELGDIRNVLLGVGILSATSSSRPRSSSGGAFGSDTTIRSDLPPTKASSTPSRRSTTPVSPFGATTSCAS